MNTSRRQKLLIGALAVAVLAGTLRLALPHVLKQQVNARLANLGPYSGSVEGVSVALVRGAYTIENMRIVKNEPDREIPFLELDSMDISVQWRALFAGELVGEIVATRPRLNFYRAEDNEDSQLGTGVNWPDAVRELFPFNFNRVEVIDGTARFLAPGIDSAEALEVDRIDMQLTNLTNVHESDALAVASLQLDGRFMQTGTLNLTGDIDPNADTPTFDINFKLENAAVTAANPWLREFINVDAESGNFSMYLEAAAANGAFEGYLKPLMEDLDIFELDHEEEGPLHKAWEAIVGFAANVFENRESDQVATRVPFSGDFEDPDIGTLAAIVNLVRNGFVSALSSSFDGTIDLARVSSAAESGS